MRGRFDQCFSFVEEPALTRVRFAAGSEHAPTCQAQLFVDLEDACLEGFLQFGLTHLERLLLLGLAHLEGFTLLKLTSAEGAFLLKSQRLELGDKLRFEGTLLREQQGFERGWIVGQLRGEDGCAHAVGGVREGGVGAARHADIIPEHTT